MTIRFEWDSGKMAVDAEVLIHDMPMSNYKKWAKLFVRYGEPADHHAFLQLLEDQIRANEQTIKDLEMEVNEWQGKAERRIRTVMTTEACRQQMRLKQRHLNGAMSNLKRRQSMYDQLKGLVA